MKGRVGVDIGIDLKRERWEAAVLKERELEAQKIQLDEQLRPLFELQGRLMPVITQHQQVLQKLKENEQELQAAYSAMRDAVV